MNYIFAALHCYEDRQTDRQETDRQTGKRRSEQCRSHRDGLREKEEEEEVLSHCTSTHLI